jgi:hypothetical protein
MTVREFHLQYVSPCVFAGVPPAATFRTYTCKVIARKRARVTQGRRKGSGDLPSFLLLAEGRGVNPSPRAPGISFADRAGRRTIERRGNYGSGIFTAKRARLLRG